MFMAFFGKLKKYTKYALTFPQVLIHRLRGVEGSYDELVTFFRYFPFARINKDRTVSFSMNGRKVEIYYGDLFPMAAGIFRSGEYDVVPVKGRVVVDIGAAIGDTAVYFSIKGARRVYGYELNKRYFDLAQRNIDLNNFRDRIEIEYCGVASRKISSSDVILGACVPEQDRQGVDGAGFKTLDTIVQEREVEDAVLKLDVDGFEYEIIRFASNETLRRFGLIFIEYHFGVQDLESKLVEAGFLVEKKKIANVVIDRHPAEYRNMDIGYILARKGNY